MQRPRRVRPTPPRVQGERQRHECKPRACPPLSTRAMEQLLRSDPLDLSPTERRLDSIAWGCNLRLPRDRQASSRRGRGSDTPNQCRQDGPRLRTVEWQERPRGPAERASVYAARHAERPMHDCHDFHAEAVRRRLGRTRTADFRPLAKRMAASCHGMRPRGRSARPLGRNGASRLHAHKIWRASECSAPWWAHRESAALAAWVATLVAAEIGRAGRATDSGTRRALRQHAGSTQARSGRALRQHSGSNHEQSRAITSTQPPHPVAPRRRRPRRGRCCLFCH